MASPLDPLAVVIGARLVEALELRGMTASDLARAIDAPYASRVLHWTAGRRVPRVQHLLDMAEVLRVSVDWLLGRDSPIQG